MARYALVSPDDQILEYRDYAEPPAPHGHAHKPRLLPVEEKNEAKENEIEFLADPVIRKTKVVLTRKSRAKTAEELKEQETQRVNVRDEIQKLWDAVRALQG